MSRSHRVVPVQPNPNHPTLAEVRYLVALSNEAAVYGTAALATAARTVAGEAIKAYFADHPSSNELFFRWGA